MALRLSEGLGGDEFVVLTVSSDPEPMDAGLSWQAQDTVVQTYSGAIHPAATELLELQRRVSWVLLQ